MHLYSIHVRVKYDVHDYRLCYGTLWKVARLVVMTCFPTYQILTASDRTRAEDVGGPEGAVHEPRR